MTTANRTYRRVASSFWTDPDIRRRARTPEEKSFLLYLFTGPDTPLSGIFFQPVPTIAGNVGIPTELAEEFMRKYDGEFLTYDWETEEVFVHRVWDHNVGPYFKAKDNRVKGLARGLLDIHSRHLVELFLELHPRYRPPQEVIDHMEGASKGLPDPPDPKGLRRGFEGASKGLRGNPESEGASKGLPPNDDAKNHDSGDTENDRGSEALCTHTHAHTLTHTHTREGDGVVTGKATAEGQPTSQPVEEEDPIQDLHPAAITALDELPKRRGVEAILRAAFIYRDPEKAMPDPSVSGLPLKRRLEITSRALVDYVPQMDHGRFQRAHFAGFVKRIRNAPRPGTEAAQVDRKGEPASSASYRPVFHERPMQPDPVPLNRSLRSVVDGLAPEGDDDLDDGVDSEGTTDKEAA